MEITISTQIVVCISASRHRGGGQHQQQHWRALRRSRHGASPYSPVTRSAHLSQHQLPNGLTIRHISTPAEAMFLYEEVYCQQQYLQHGVRLEPGDTVVDVGANIGLFSLFAAEAVGPLGRVLSLEAAPQTAAALSANIQHHDAWCAEQGKQVAHCTVVQAAVTRDQVPPEVQFTVYPRAPGWSTLVRDDAEVLTNMQSYLRTLLLEEVNTSGPQPQPASESSESMGAAASTAVDRGWSLPQRLLVACARQLARVPWLRGMADALAVLYVKQVMLRDAETVSVPTVTLSRIIKEFELKNIHLLKVDVERAELLVLQGISQQHWPIIQQVTMEVHDIDGGLAEIVKLLRNHGFSFMTYEQLGHVQGTSLYNLYATRAAAGETTC